MKPQDGEIRLCSGGASAPAGVSSSGFVAEELQLRPEPSSGDDAETSTSSGLRQFKQRRLPGFDYTGRYAYHLVAVTTNREPLLVDDVARGVVAALTEAAAATTFELLTYLVMPDHVHLLAQGAADDANAIRFMQRFKQLTGFRYKQRYGTALWQHSFYDRVLRRDEDLLTVARYILGNPIRAGLIAADGVWPFQGGTLFEGVDENERRAANSEPTGAEAPPLRGLRDRDTAPLAVDTETAP
jgi:REP element-mobilizing transposase RayT